MTSHAFRELLRKIGSGPHTGENLTRQESALALRWMLLQEATPAQIGAFLIAHRIKRPTGEELAGMLDTYGELGPKLSPIASHYPVLVMGSPYDGRSRTASLSPLTALVLAAAGCAVLLHGGDRMPTKEGVPLVDTWQQLGIDWTHLSLAQVQQVLEQTHVGFVYLPTHFPLAHSLVPYRDQIGKRPPLATLELIWNPYSGPSHLAAGFVHPPTEELFKTALCLRQTYCFTTVKGLEGSCDLPRERTGIVGLATSDAATGEFHFDRLHLHPRDYGLTTQNVDLTTLTPAAMQSVLAGEESELQRSILLNSGFYLWRCGACQDIETGMAMTETLLKQGAVAKQRQFLQAAIEHGR